MSARRARTSVDRTPSGIGARVVQIAEERRGHRRAVAWDVSKRTHAEETERREKFTRRQRRTLRWQTKRAHLLLPAKRAPCTAQRQLPLGREGRGGFPLGWTVAGLVRDARRSELPSYLSQLPSLYTDDFDLKRVRRTGRAAHRPSGASPAERRSNRSETAARDGTLYTGAALAGCGRYDLAGAAHPRRSARRFTEDSDTPRVRPALVCTRALVRQSDKERRREGCRGKQPVDAPGAAPCGIFTGKSGEGDNISSPPRCPKLVLSSMSCIQNLNQNLYLLPEKPDEPRISFCKRGRSHRGVDVSTLHAKKRRADLTERCPELSVSARTALTQALWPAPRTPAAPRDFVSVVASLSEQRQAEISQMG
ncbi:unnamed protein product [Lampetra planeri]